MTAASRSRTRIRARSRGWLAFVALATGGGCTPEDATGTDAIAPRAVVHAVLDLNAHEQVILVERSRLGEHGDTLSTPPYDPDDQILARGGDPIRGARVVLYDASGDSAVAVEDAAWRPDGVGAGVYRIATRDADGAAPPGTFVLRRGGTYRLRVDTPLGTVRGTTRLPDVRPHSGPASPIRHDVHWPFPLPLSPVTPTAPAYVVSLSTDATRVVLADIMPVVRVHGDGVHVTTGENNSWLRLSTCEPASLSLSAVDANYAKYARARDRDNLHGDDLRTAGISGGSGVFGAIVPYAAYDVTAFSSIAGPLDGRWRALATTSGDVAEGTTMCLFGSRQGGGLEFFGTWRPPASPVIAALFGRVYAERTRAAFTLIMPDERQRPIQVDAGIRGDTLDGRDQRTGRRVRFVRDGSN